MIPGKINGWAAFVFPPGFYASSVVVYGIWLEIPKVRISIVAVEF